MTPELAVGWSALVAAAATVFGMIALLLFFSRGQPWGTVNDAASVVLMLALIPVALVMAAIESEPPVATTALAVAALGIVAMLVAAVLQALLVIGRVTYEQTRLRVLGAGAFVGFWYVLAGAIGFRPLGQLLGALAIASGAGFIAVAYGFAVGGERHPLSAIGGILAFAASTAFLAILGVRLVSGDLTIPTWNA